VADRMAVPAEVALAVVTPEDANGPPSDAVRTAADTARTAPVAADGRTASPLDVACSTTTPIDVGSADTFTTQNESCIFMMTLIAQLHRFERQEQLLYLQYAKIQFIRTINCS